MNHSRRKGFTLVEVMVALAVVAVALPALLFTLDQQIDGTGYLRERSRAQWVAANRLAEIRLLAVQSGALDAGRANGETEMAGVVWYWSTVIEQTQVPGFFRIDIKVASEPGENANSLTTLSAFLSPEQPVATP